MDPLQRVRIGTTGIEVTRVGLGCAPLGSIYSDIPDEQAQQVVRAALQAGVTFIDTAALYGAGISERRVGAALRGVPRDSYVLATKVGWRFEHVPGPSAFSKTWDSPGAWMVECRRDYGADWVERSLDNSLTRLGVDRLDVVHIHDPDEDEHFAEAMDGAYPVLDRLRSQGVIGAVGAGMNQSEMLVRLARAGDFDCFLLAGRYTILEQGALDELLPLCMEQDIGIIAGGTFNSGILASGSKGGPDGARYDYMEAPPDIVAKVRSLETAAATHGVDLRAAASQFALAHPAVACIVPGTRRPERVLDNLELVRAAIPAAFWQELRDRDLIRRDAPVPA